MRFGIMSMLKSLEDLCLDFLLKSCNICYFTDEEKEGYKLFLYCQVDEILTQVSSCVYLLCQCPNFEHKSDLRSFCDWCLFYKDLVTFSGEFNNIRA